MQPEVVELGKGITEDDLLFHDEKAPEPSLAYLLSRMRYPEFPEPIGVFRAVDMPRYDELINDQVEEARKQRGDGDLEKLFHTGETWDVSESEESISEEVEPEPASPIERCIVDDSIDMLESQGADLCGSRHAHLRSARSVGREDHRLCHRGRK